MELMLAWAARRGMWIGEGGGKGSSRHCLPACLPAGLPYSPALAGRCRDEGGSPRHARYLRTTPRSLPHAAVVGRRPSAPACWVVLDHAQRIAGSELLTVLMRVRGSSGANVGVLLISSVAWASGRYLRDTASAPDPDTLFFPAYRPDQLQRVGGRVGACMC